MNSDDARALLDEGTAIFDEPVPWAEAAHDPCPECGVCQDAHGETRRQFHRVTNATGRISDLRKRGETEGFTVLPVKRSDNRIGYHIRPTGELTLGLTA